MSVIDTGVSSEPLEGDTDAEHMPLPMSGRVSGMV
jgi:hypothetical protein